ncbi:MAG: hypothetical protein EBY52_08535 [Actinobacteria bacterium]|nr:hypothetical protein [Actinomycetota bacterium]
MIFVLVLVAGILGTGLRPPTSMQPAMVRAANGSEQLRRRVGPSMLGVVPVDDEDDTNIIMDSLRAIGLVRRRVDRPIVGRKAYVRWWERIRAIMVLAALVIGLGIALAAVVGITVLGLGFLLERAIS